MTEESIHYDKDFALSNRLPGVIVQDVLKSDGIIHV